MSALRTKAATQPAVWGLRIQASQLCFHACMQLLSLPLPCPPNLTKFLLLVMSTPIPRHALPASQWLREVCFLMPIRKGHGQPPTTTTNYCFQMYPYTLCTPNQAELTQ